MHVPPFFLQTISRLHFLLTSGCAAFLAFAFIASAVAAPLAAETILRQTLHEGLLKGKPDGSIQEVALSSNSVREIVRERLDSKLLASVTLISGKDFRFTAAGQNTNAQIALLVLTYPNEKIAQLMAKKLANRAGFFRNSKILTRFAYGQFSDRLVITFTENAGNDAVVEVVKTFPEHLKAAADASN